MKIILTSTGVSRPIPCASALAGRCGVTERAAMRTIFIRLQCTLCINLQTKLSLERNLLIN